MNLMSAQTTVTMTSLEIAKFTGKRHDNVKRDVEEMLKQLGFIDFLSFEDVYMNEQNQQVKLYRLDKKHTICLIAGYDANRRMEIIDRLEYLENVIRNQTMINFNDPVAAARAWADNYEQLQIAQQKLLTQDDLLDEATNHLETYLKLMGDGELVTTTEAAKMLGMRSAVELNKKLRDDGVKFKNKDLPMSGFTDWFKVVPVETRSGNFKNQCYITRTGLDSIGKRYQ